MFRNCSSGTNRLRVELTVFAMISASFSLFSRSPPDWKRKTICHNWRLHYSIDTRVVTYFRENTHRNHGSVHCQHQITPLLDDFLHLSCFFFTPEPFSNVTVHRSDCVHDRTRRDRIQNVMRKVVRSFCRKSSLPAIRLFE